MSSMDIVLRNLECIAKCECGEKTPSFIYALINEYIVALILSHYQVAMSLSLLCWETGRSVRESVTQPRSGSVSVTR